LLIILQIPPLQALLLSPHIGLHRSFKMLILRLAAFLLPFLLCTTTASVLGNPQSKQLRAVHAKDAGSQDAVPRSNDESVNRKKCMH
jgi:hypothetical protein